MTIDEALGTIKGERWIGCQEKYVEAMNLIADAMHKYQKIGEILRADFEEYHPLDRDPYKLHLIEKVMLDGNDN